MTRMLIAIFCLSFLSPPREISSSVQQSLFCKTITFLDNRPSNFSPKIESPRYFKGDIKRRKL